MRGGGTGVYVGGPDPGPAARRRPVAEAEALSGPAAHRRGAPAVPRCVRRRDRAPGPAPAGRDRRRRGELDRGARRARSWRPASASSPGAPRSSCCRPGSGCSTTRRSDGSMDPARARKLGERIAQIVAEMLERRIKDPRLGFVTVTEARVTGDLREATVFYTVLRLRGRAARDGRRAGQRDRPDPVRGRQADRHQAHPVDRLRAGHGARHGRGPSRTWWRGPGEADAAVAAARAGAVPAGRPRPVPDPRRADEDDEDDDDDDDDDGPRTGGRYRRRRRRRTTLGRLPRPTPERRRGILAVVTPGAPRSPISRPSGRAPSRSSTARRRSAWPATSGRTRTRSARCSRVAQALRARRRAAPAARRA